MLVNNADEITNAVVSDRELSRLRKAVVSAVDSAIAAAHPLNLVRDNVKLSDDGKKLYVCGECVVPDLSRFREIYCIGGGKASGFMAQELESILGKRITGGLVNVLDGTRDYFSTRRIALNSASHPIPNNAGMHGVERMLGFPHDEDTLIICLISGGGSALLPAPAEGVALNDIQKITSLLIESGACINDVNTVRKHLDRIKGGGLARALHPATIITLIISDVIGDRLDVIASGPTVPDPTTFQDAKRILENHALWKNDDTRTPESVIKRISEGVSGKIPETPKPGDPVFVRVHNLIIGSNRTAVLSAKKSLEEHGFKCSDVLADVDGEARAVGIRLAARSLTLNRNEFVVGGGETTVKVKGKGQGGRNSEVALSFAIDVCGTRNPIVFASFGTDGVDGSSPAAGGIIDSSTIKSDEVRASAIAALDDNDSYGFLSKQGGCSIMTGPTGTNVNDVFIMVRA